MNIQFKTSHENGDVYCIKDGENVGVCKSGNDPTHWAYWELPQGRTDTCGDFHYIKQSIADCYNFASRI